jgi:hypothetical protein
MRPETRSALAGAHRHVNVVHFRFPLLNQCLVTNPRLPRDTLGEKPRVAEQRVAAALMHDLTGFEKFVGHPRTTKKY